MKQALILSVSAAVLFLAAGSASAQDAKVEKGKAAYAATPSCKMCHSIGASGNKANPLDEVGSKLTPEQIKEWLTDPVGMTVKMKATGKPPMKLAKPLPAEDVDAMVAYLSTLKKK